MWIHVDSMSDFQIPKKISRRLGRTMRNRLIGKNHLFSWVTLMKLSFLRQNRPKDFIPLVKAILKLAERRGSPKVARSQVGVFLNSSHSWPIGFGRYTDFKHYTHSASRFGYVLLGSDDVTRTGHEWIQSTGTLERACGGE